MGGIGSGPPRGVKPKRPRSPRKEARDGAPITKAIKLDVWQWYRDGLLLGRCKVVYGYTRDGSEGEISVASRGWSDDTLSCVVRLDKGRGLDVRVARKRNSNPRFKTDYRLICPRCEGRNYCAYVFEGDVGCRKCLGLYYVVTNKRAEAVFEGYSRLKDSYEACRRHWQEYEVRRDKGIRAAWQGLGDCRRPTMLRTRIARLKGQMLQRELQLWSGAASTIGNAQCTE